MRGTCEDSRCEYNSPCTRASAELRTERLREGIEEGGG